MPAGLGTVTGALGERIIIHLHSHRFPAKTMKARRAVHRISEKASIEAGSTPGDLYGYYNSNFPYPKSGAAPDYCKQ